MKLKPLDDPTYHPKVWDAMNELEMVTSKICSARDICDTVAELISKNDYAKAESLANASYEFLNYFLQEFDVKFKRAWDVTLNAANVADNSVSIQDQKYTAQYTEEELNAMCDAAEGTTLTKNKTWVVPIEEDHLGEYYVTFPDELIEKVGWSENDTLEWIDNKDGTFSIKKIEN